MEQESMNLSEKIVKAASDKKAIDIVVMNMEEISSVTDSFVICSGSSFTQIQAIADHIEKELAEQGIRLQGREGNRDSKWILLDYGSCVVHIFIDTERQFYRLEQLWGNAKQMEIHAE